MYLPTGPMYKLLVLGWKLLIIVLFGFGFMTKTIYHWMFGFGLIINLNMTARSYSWTTFNTNSFFLFRSRFVFLITGVLMMLMLTHNLDDKDQGEWKSDGNEKYWEDNLRISKNRKKESFNYFDHHKLGAHTLTIFAGWKIWIIKTWQIIRYELLK